MSTKISAGVDYCPSFITFIAMIPIANIFTDTFLFTFQVTIIMFGELTSATSKERMTTNIIFAGTTPINYERFICQ